MNLTSKNKILKIIKDLFNNRISTADALAEYKDLNENITPIIHNKKLSEIIKQYNVYNMCRYSAVFSIDSNDFSKLDGIGDIPFDIIGLLDKVIPSITMGITYEKMCQTYMPLGKGRFFIKKVVSASKTIIIFSYSSSSYSNKNRYNKFVSIIVNLLSTNIHQYLYFDYISKAVDKIITEINNTGCFYLQFIKLTNSDEIFSSRNYKRENLISQNILGEILSINQSAQIGIQILLGNYAILHSETKNILVNQSKKNLITIESINIIYESCYIECSNLNNRNALKIKMMNFIDGN